MGLRDRGIVERMIEPAPGGQRSLHRRLDLGRVGNIREQAKSLGAKLADGLRTLFQLVFIEVRERKPRTLACGGERAGPPDPSRRTTDQHHFTIKQQGHLFLLPLSGIGRHPGLRPTRRLPT